MNTEDAELVDALLSRLRLAKCGPQALTDEQLDIRAAKQEWIALREELGLSRRRAAQLLGKSPSTLDGWERPGDFERYPPRHVFDTLRRRAATEASGEYGSVKGTGT